MDEFKQPFESDDSPVSKAGLSLISIETKVVPCPFRKKWLTEGGDPEAHARSFIPAMRAWSNSTFLSGKTQTRFGFYAKSVLCWFVSVVCLKLQRPVSLLRTPNRPSGNFGLLRGGEGPGGYLTHVWV